MSSDTIILNFNNKIVLGNLLVHVDWPGAWKMLAPVELSLANVATTVWSLASRFGNLRVHVDWGWADARTC
jgi:hypothetical protein